MTELWPANFATYVLRYDNIHQPVSAKYRHRTNSFISKNLFKLISYETFHFHNVPFNGGYRISSGAGTSS